MSRVPWPHRITLNELAQNDAVQSVFEPDPRHPDPQFKELWWHRTKGRDLRHFSVSSGGMELARVTVKVGGRVLAAYSGLHAGKLATEILYIEVGNDLLPRFSGIGSAAVASVSGAFGGVMFAKAAPVPGGFWARLGWNEYPPRERPEHTWRLFVRPD